MINANFCSLHFCYIPYVYIHDKDDAYFFSATSEIQKYERWLKRDEEKSMQNVFIQISLFNFLKKMHNVL